MECANTIASLVVFMSKDLVRSSHKYMMYIHQVQVRKFDYLSIHTSDLQLVIQIMQGSSII